MHKDYAIIACFVIIAAYQFYIFFSICSNGSRKKKPDE
jgi:hypothetical protein